MALSLAPLARTAAALCAGGLLASTAAAQCQFAELAARTPLAQAEFGRAIAVGQGHALVGAPESGGQGLVTVFGSAGGNVLFELVGSDTAAGDSFGESVAIGEGLAVVGAPLDDDHGAASGGAYVFDLATGVELYKLTAPDGAASDLFGIAVAVGGGYVVVGADGDDDAASNSGSVYVFVAATGQYVTKLHAGDPNADARFGGALAVDGDFLVVGAWNKTVSGVTSRGAAYGFQLSSGMQLYRLTSSDGHSFDYFATSVATSAGFVLVGSPRTDHNGPNSGAGYVFDAATGQQLWILVPASGAAGDFCGNSVASDGTLAVLGAPFHDGSAMNTGIAHVFRMTTGDHVQDLAAADAEAQDQLGSALAWSDGRVLAGAPLRSRRATQAGAAYVFAFDGNDCNANGIADACDLAARTSVDVNQDGVPDECQGGPFWVRSPWNQRWYTALPQANWVGHEIAARAWGGHLATVASVDEDAWLRSRFPFRAAHLGYTDAPQEGNFVWISGDPPTYENWAPGQPDDMPGAFGADYAVWDPSRAQWRDEPDKSAALGLVEVVSDDCDGNLLPDVYEIAAGLRNDWDGDGVLDDCVSANYCVATVNSSGLPARMDPEGSPSVADNAFVLVARDVAKNRLGYFLGSQTTDFVPNFGGSSGNLCLGGTLLRFSKPPTGDVLNSGPNGELRYQPDLGNFPQGWIVSVGDVWYFQAWFRDVVGGPTSNTSDGIEVLFR